MTALFEKHKNQSNEVCNDLTKSLKEKSEKLEIAKNKIDKYYNDISN